MLSCRKATELIEKKQITSLGTVEKVQLNLHKKMCNACSAYERQSIFIASALDKHYKQEKKQVNMSEREKKELIERLNSELKNNSDK